MTHVTIGQSAQHIAPNAGHIDPSDRCRLDHLASAAASGLLGGTGRAIPRAPHDDVEETQMFDEGQLYSPVTASADGKAEVHLGAQHPGVADPAYRERRNEIAAAALAWKPGEPIPHIDYTDEENGVWATVCTALAPKHEAKAHPEPTVDAPAAEPTETSAAAS